MWDTEHLVCSQTYLGTGRELLISSEVQTSLKKKVTLAFFLRTFPVGKSRPSFIMVPELRGSHRRQVTYGNRTRRFSFIVKSHK